MSTFPKLFVRFCDPVYSIMFAFGSESAKVRLQPSFTLLDVANTDWGGVSQTRKTGKHSPSAPSTWARKRVQLSPELLRGVFEHLNNVDNARNARVCRNWRDGALTSVWRCVDLGDALRLLAPLVKNKKGGFYVSITMQFCVKR